jgi:hypothetical protein
MLASRRKHIHFFAILSALVLIFPLGLLARDKDQGNVHLFNSVRVRDSVLSPGIYKVEWQPSGAQHVQVKFMQEGKTMATAPAIFKTNDQQVRQDDVVLSTKGGQRTLAEIDFAHNKEALIFRHS